MRTVPSGLLLTDSTMPVNFCQAGANCALAMLDHLGESLYMVAEVRDELKRIAEGLPALQRFLDEFPEERIRHLEVELAVEVARVKRAIQIPGSHSNEDLGEIASVFYAESRRERDEVFAVVTDDGTGRRLAADRGLVVITTQDLVSQMVCSGTLTYAEGQRVWQRRFSNPQKWKAYREQIDRECPERLAAAS